MVRVRILIASVLTLGHFFSMDAVASSCDIHSSDTIATSLGAYQDCIDAGHQMATDIRAELGAAAFRKKDYETAALHFSEIIALNLSAGGTALAPIYFEKALSEFAQKDKAASLESLDNAIAANPEYSRAYFARALRHEKKKA